MSADNYEHELTGNRTEIAAAVTGVANGVLAGRIRLGEGDETVAVTTPEELSLEIELESGADERELELEPEWPTPEGDGPVVPHPVEDEAEAAAHRSGDDGNDDAGDELPTEDTPSAPVGPAATAESLARFEVFHDRGDEWRWRLRHRNGNVIATSGEGYTRKHNARKGLRSVVRNAPTAEVTAEWYRPGPVGEHVREPPEEMDRGPKCGYRRRGAADARGRYWGAASASTSSPAPSSARWP